MFLSYPDSRFLSYPPSVMATATILHVFNGFQPCIGDEYHNQVLDILGIDKVSIFMQFCVCWIKCLLWDAIETVHI